MKDEQGNSFEYGNPFPTTVSYDDDFSFNSSFVSNNATTPVTVRSGESGKSIYITDIVLSASGAGRVDLQDADGTLILPVFLGSSAPFVARLATPKKVTAAKNLMIKSTTAVNLAVSIDGYVK